MSEESFVSLTNIYKNYSKKDIAEALFISSIWLPNIACPAKHLWAISVYLALDSEGFQIESRIKTYDELVTFLNDVFSKMPDFSSFEDFIPELDWGDIFFHHEKNFQIFYGSEIEFPYDFLQLFQLFYGPFREQIVDKTGLDPMEDLTIVLSAQDLMISTLTTQPPFKEVKEKIEPGFFESPSQDFWNECISKKIMNINETLHLKADFLSRYTTQPGELKKEALITEFGDSLFNGSLVNYLFVKAGADYIPLLPRRFNSCLFFQWEKYLSENYLKIFQESEEYVRRLGRSLYNYFDSRVKTPDSQKFLFVSAADNNGETCNPTIFPIAFISRNKLVLVHLLNPQPSPSGLERDLQEIQPVLQKAKDLLEAHPIKLCIHSMNKTIVFEEKDNGEKLQTLIIEIVPMLTPITSVHRLPKNFPAKVMLIHQFVGILDEIQNIEQFSDFFEYLEEYGSKLLMWDLVDMYMSFKLSDRVLVKGAIQPSMVFLDPHIGSSERFETLINFCKDFPSNDFFKDPREWKVERQSDKAVRLISRTQIKTLFCCIIGKTQCLIGSHFEKQNLKQMQLSDLLMQCIEDSLSTRNAFVQRHQFFQIFRNLRVFFFPRGLVKNQDCLSNLRHLDPADLLWTSDIGFIEKGRPCIRVVYNEERVFGAFAAAKDSTEEVNLLLEILKKINTIIVDDNFEQIRNSISITSSEKPRFKIFSKDVRVSFSTNTLPYKPSTYHFKLAARRLSEIAKGANIVPGYYELESAKNKVNELRENMVNEIDREVSNYNFEKSISFIISEIETLDNQFIEEALRIESSLEQQVDYNREERYADELIAYSTLSRYNRYLIEKFVQLSPKGSSTLNREQYGYLVALIDILHMLYQTSDNLHYGIFPLGVNIDEDYLFNVTYLDDIAAKKRKFSEEKAQVMMGIIGQSSDKLEPRSFDVLKEKIDEAFKEEMTFGFLELIGTLQILSLWASYLQIDFGSYYHATRGEIVDICSQNIEGYNKDNALKLIDFLTLKSADVVQVIGSSTPCADLPIWEYNKRFSRYSLRPLIEINGQLYWGPYSARKTWNIWVDQISNARLPFEIQGKKIQQVIDELKRQMDLDLEKKTFEIVKRFTTFVERNVEIHKRDAKGNHPTNLGDFDVLSFHSHENVILNIECKNLSQQYCLKDLQRLKRTLFHDYLVKFNHRQRYLADNCNRIIRALGWPSTAGKELPPKIINIFLTPEPYWWTKYPPVETSTLFLQVNLLADFIQNLGKETS